MADQLAMIWNDMGFIRWPLFFSFMAVIGLASWSALKLFRHSATPDLHTKALLDAILFWGGSRR